MAEEPQGGSYAIKYVIVENGLEKISCLVVSHHHTVVLTNRRRLDG